MNHKSTILKMIPLHIKVGAWDLQYQVRLFTHSPTILPLAVMTI